MEPLELETVFIRSYPNYNLMGRIKKEDLEQYNKTHNEKLIIYRFCELANNRGIKHDYKQVKKTMFVSGRLDRRKSKW